jgi:hypothetical protein
MSRHSLGPRSTVIGSFKTVGVRARPQADGLKGRISRAVRWRRPVTIRASWRNAAHTLAYFGEDISAMMELIDRTLAVNPSYSRGWHISSVLRR